MSDTDSSNAIVRPPIAWALALAIGVALEWFFPTTFVPASVPHVVIGIALFAAVFTLAIWAIRTIRRSGSHIETTKPTTAIVTSGPYRFTRNPVYLAMLFGQSALAVAFDSVWILVTLAPFYLVLRYGVVAREEAYLERKFSGEYLAYKSSVRRWL